MAYSERYQRQLILKDFGPDAQSALANAAVMVVGAGGLGCAVLQYLAAAGVGTIGIADGDRVQLSNLHRQVLYGQEDIGKFKAEVAAGRLRMLNNEIRINAWSRFWNNQDCIDHFPSYTIIIDATDNFASRYMINDACVLLDKPLVFGAVSGFEGQVALFRETSYRDLFPVPPKSFEVANCEQAGVLGVLPGIIGVMQAAEAIKWLTGTGEVLKDRMLTYDVLQHTSYILEIIRNKAAENHIPASIAAFLQTEYAQLCGISDAAIQEMTVDDFLEQRSSLFCIDVREEEEQPRIDNYMDLVMPLSRFSEIQVLWGNKTPVLICQSGQRSLKAAHVLRQMQGVEKCYSLKGGMRELLKTQNLEYGR